MSNEKEAFGSCLCGTVRFRVELPTKWCAHCHCSMCRRAHGAGVVTWVGVETESFHIISGQESLQSYRSSAEAERRFCGRCGSSLFFNSTRWPGETHIALANFDTPIDRQPEGHAFHDDRVDWIRLMEF